MNDGGAMRDLKVQWTHPDSLKPYERNARTHNDEQIEQIARSLDEFGWTNPILTDAGLGIIAGHGRWLAARKRARDSVPYIILDGLSDEQRRAYIIADNKLAMNAGWDEKLLGLELGDLRTANFDLNFTGFASLELRHLFAQRTGGLTDPDSVVEPPLAPVSQLGDLWTLGRHRLLCGDCTGAARVTALLGADRPNLMVTDPPYGVNYNPKWRDDLGIDWAGQAQRLSTHPDAKPLTSRALGKVKNDDRADWRDAWALFPGDVAYVWHGGLHVGEVQASLEAVGFQMRAQIIWVKQHFVFSRGDYHWQHEPLWYAVRKGAAGRWAGDRKQTTTWSIANASAFKGEKDDATTGHGTQKPVECMRRPIENNSLADDTVYDPFVGSGTTIIAAEMTGRICLALELSPAYVDVCVRRWQDFTGKVATLDGKPFDVVKAERS